MLEVGGAVLVRWRADRDELEEPVTHALCGIGGKREPSSGNILAQHVVEAGLVDRHTAALEHGDLLGIDVDAEDIVADLGQADAGDEADIAAAKNRDIHGGLRSMGFMGVAATGPACRESGVMLAVASPDGLGAYGTWVCAGGGPAASPLGAIGVATLRAGHAGRAGPEP